MNTRTRFSIEKEASISDSDTQSSHLDPMEMVRTIKTQGPAPVHLWDPPFCGDMDMIIRRDGAWIHEGKPIRRKAMRQLFASILKREDDGEYYLVTPVEKVRIQVEDCPFLIDRMEVSGEGESQQITLTTDLDEEFTVDADHALQFGEDPDSGEPHPAVHVRNGLNGLIGRNVFYRLVDLAIERPAGKASVLGVYSGGQFFPLGHV